jgi:hypothetical protein
VRSCELCLGILLGPVHLPRRTPPTLPHRRASSRQ